MKVLVKAAAPIMQRGKKSTKQSRRPSADARPLKIKFENITIKNPITKNEVKLWSFRFPLSERMERKMREKKGERYVKFYAKAHEKYKKLEKRFKDSKLAAKRKDASEGAAVIDKTKELITTTIGQPKLSQKEISVAKSELEKAVESGNALRRESLQWVIKNNGALTSRESLSDLWKISGRLLAERRKDKKSFLNLVKELFESVRSIFISKKQQPNRGLK